MIFIKQKCATDCGVAALAMLANITYKQSRNILHPNRKSFFKRLFSPNYDYMTNFNSIQSAAIEKELGLKTVYFGFKADITSLPTSAIIGVWVNKDKTKSHAVVWDIDTKQIMDPYTFKKKYSLEYCQDNMNGYLLLTRL